RVRESVLDLAQSGDARLRFQVALSLGEWDSDRILGPLAEIALRGADDRWTRLAVASSVPHRAGALATVLLGPKRGLTREGGVGGPAGAVAGTGGAGRGAARAGRGGGALAGPARADG